MVLPAPGKVTQIEHHAALPWQELPRFVAKLAKLGGMGSLALRFAILTAARSGEVRLAAWDEIDRRASLWIVPAGRMKARRPHRVPLSDAALAVLDLAQGGRDRAASDVIFYGQRSRNPLSNMSLTAVLRRMGHGELTVHGFRSSFRDWVAEATDHPGEAAELALAHAVGNRVEAAYRRGDLLARRVRLMADWGAYCCSGATTYRQSTGGAGSG